MAATVHANIRLDTSLDGSGLPVNTYKVTFGGYNNIFEPALSTEKSLTGALIVHRLRSGGTVITFDDRQYTLLLTRAEKDQLSPYLGLKCYFMPHYRDEADVATYRNVMVLKSITEVKPLVDATLEYWLATIYLQEARGNTADT